MKTIINWFGIPASDFNRAVTFYNTILGIEMVKSKDPKDNDIAFFYPLGEEETVNGGVTANPEMKPGKDGPLIYLNCTGKLDDVIGRVEGAGGQVAMPKTSIGDHGNIAMIIDTEGNLVGLHSM